MRDQKYGESYLGLSHHKCLEHPCSVKATSEEATRSCRRQQMLHLFNNAESDPVKRYEQNRELISSGHKSTRKKVKDCSKHLFMFRSKLHRLVP